MFKIISRQRLKTLEENDEKYFKMCLNLKLYKQHCSRFKSTHSIYNFIKNSGSISKVISDLEES